MNFFIYSKLGYNSIEMILQVNITRSEITTKVNPLCSKGNQIPKKIVFS